MNSTPPPVCSTVEWFCCLLRLSGSGRVWISLPKGVWHQQGKEGQHAVPARPHPSPHRSSGSLSFASLLWLLFVACGPATLELSVEGKINSSHNSLRDRHLPLSFSWRIWFLFHYLFTYLFILDFFRAAWVSHQKLSRRYSDFWYILYPLLSLPHYQRPWPDSTFVTISEPTWTPLSPRIHSLLVYIML